MYFSCRKPQHSCQLHCIQATLPSPFTRGEREKMQPTSSSNWACLHQNFCLILFSEPGVIQEELCSFHFPSHRARRVGDTQWGSAGCQHDPSALLHSAMSAVQSGSAEPQSRLLSPAQRFRWHAALPVISTMLPRTSPLQKHSWPGALAACSLQAVGVADEFVQHVDNLSKFRPVTALLLPAV